MRLLTIARIHHEFNSCRQQNKTIKPTTAKNAQIDREKERRERREKIRKNYNILSLNYLLEGKFSNSKKSHRQIKTRIDKSGEFSIL